jgi:hypothetical protein
MQGNLIASRYPSSMDSFLHAPLAIRLASAATWTATARKSLLSFSPGAADRSAPFEFLGTYPRLEASLISSACTLWKLLCSNWHSCHARDASRKHWRGT